jgi:tetratricopeptide (TPR) repeat protein
MSLNKTLYDSAVMWLKSGKTQEALDIIALIEDSHDLSDVAIETLRASALMARGGVGDYNRADYILGDLSVKYAGGDPNVWIQFADLRMLQGNAKDADRAADVALSINPVDTVAMIKKFSALNALGQYRDAMSMINQIVDIEPTPANRMTKGIQMLLLASDDKLADLASVGEYSYRYPDHRSDSKGPVLLEQGVGDVIMMLPYMAKMKDLGISVTGDSRHADVLRFLSELDSVNSYTSRTGYGLWMFDMGVAIGRFDYHDYAEMVRNDIKSLTGLYSNVFSAFKDRTLVCFRGNPAHPNDRFRSIPFSVIRPYIEQNGSKYVVVGHNLTDEQMAFCKYSGAYVWDALGIMPMASMVQSCKNVVTVDTAWGHMAGLMGVDTTIMLSTLVDWRWGVSANDTFRYPSVKLVRQSKFNDWSDVLGECIA